MAITIHQDPFTGGFPAGNLNHVLPAFNDLIYVVSSDNRSQTNFQYVCDIYITKNTSLVSHAGQNYIRRKVPADPIYSSGVFNITEVARNFLSSDIGDDAYGVQTCPDSVVVIQCKFGEEYGPSSGVTVYSDLATSTSGTIWNAVFDFQDWKNFDALDWENNGANTDCNFLTERPSSGTIRSDEKGWLHAVSRSNGGIRYFYVEVWKQNGTFQRLFQINNPYTNPFPDIARRHVRFPTGLEQLDQIPASDLLSGTQPISLNAGRYRIYTTNASSGVTRQSQWYVVDDDTCTQYDRYRLHWRNKLGGYDSFTFIRAHKFTSEIQRDKFKRNMITRIGGGKYGYNMSDRSDVTHRTKLKDKILLNSDWITETQSVWLEQLVSSPEVYHDDPDNGLVAINIVESSYERKQHVTDVLFNLQLTFEYSYDRYREDL